MGYKSTRAAGGKLSKVSPTTLLDVISGQGESTSELDALAADMTDDTAFVRGSRFVVRDLKLQPGEHALVVNGRVCLFFPLCFRFHADVSLVICRL